MIFSAFAEILHCKFQNFVSSNLYHQKPPNMNRLKSLSKVYQGGRYSGRHWEVIILSIIIIMGIIISSILEAQ